MIKPRWKFTPTIQKSGTMEQPTYEEIITPKGSKDLEKTGSQDMQQYIDSFKEDCDINMLLKKFTNSGGDPTVLNVHDLPYGEEVTNKSLNELHQENYRITTNLNNDSKLRTFASTYSNIKASPEEFIADFEKWERENNNNANNKKDA